VSKDRSPYRHRCRIVTSLTLTAARRDFARRRERCRCVIYWRMHRLLCDKTFESAPKSQLARTRKLHRERCNENLETPRNCDVTRRNRLHDLSAPRIADTHVAANFIENSSISASRASFSLLVFLFFFFAVITFRKPT